MKDYKIENKILKKQLKAYKSAYLEINCYFDSIDEEEQEKLQKRLIKIFKKLDK